MKLSNEQTAKTLEFFESVWPDPKNCPICKHTSWNLLEMVFELRETSVPEQPASEESAIPIVAIMCKTCGHTLFFNALAIGVLPGEDT